MRKLLLFTSLSTLALAGAAHAQSDADAADAADVISVTSLRPILIDDVTTAVKVIDADEIAIRNAPFLADLLRSAPALGVSRAGGFGGLTQIRIRGAEANHTLVLIDGIEASDPATGETDLSLWSGLDAQRIEVAQGEQSALYGSDAIGGVIMVTTGGEGARAAVEGGSFGTVRGNLGVDGKLDKAAFGLTASGFTTNGVDTSGLGGEKDGTDSWSVAGRVAIELGAGWSLNSLARYGETEAQFDSDTDFDGALNDVDRLSDSAQTLLGAALLGATGTVDHALRVSWGQVERENFSDDAFTGSTTGKRLKLSYSPSSTRDWAGATHQISGLVDYEQEDYERVAVNTAFGDPNQSQEFDTLGVAGEYRLSAGSFALNASVRHDDNDDRFEDATTWRAGAAYAFDFGGRARFSIGAGVKNPNFTELFGFFPGSFIGNPDLEPERSQSWELGWDQTLSHGLSASVTYFSAKLEDEIFTAFNPDFTSSPANRNGESEREGVEFSTEWNIIEGLTAYGAASYVNSDNDSNEKEIRVPEWTGSFAMSWTPPNIEKFTGGFALDIVGAQDDFNFGTFPAARVTLDSYVLASATAAYALTDRISLTLRGDNLFDSEAVDVLGYSRPGAGVFVGLQIK